MLSHQNFSSRKILLENQRRIAGQIQRQMGERAENKIAAIAESPTDALRKAYEKTKAKVMYINKVGEEKKVMRKRIRRYNVEHDQRYQ